MRNPILVVIALAACGGGKGGGAGNAGGAVQASIDATCSKAFECRDEFPPDQGVEFEQIFGTSEAECVANFTEALDPADVQESVAAGRVIFDAADAQVCLAAVNGVTCGQFFGDEPFTQPPECDTAFVGTVPSGGACTIDLDCAGDGDCNVETLTCSGGSEVVFVDELSTADQAALCEDFLDAFCAPGEPNETFCADPCIETGCAAAAQNGNIDAQCGPGDVTVNEVLECASDGTTMVCGNMGTNGPGCIGDALLVACPPS
jgi:hypothetical protein